MMTLVQNLQIYILAQHNRDHVYMHSIMDDLIL